VHLNERTCTGECFADDVSSGPATASRSPAGAVVRAKTRLLITRSAAALAVAAAAAEAVWPRSSVLASLLGNQK